MCRGGDMGEVCRLVSEEEVKEKLAEAAGIVREYCYAVAEMAKLEGMAKDEEEVFWECIEDWTKEFKELAGLTE